MKRKGFVAPLHIFDLAISSKAKLVYLHLCSTVDWRSSTRADAGCRDTIAEHCGFHRNTVGIAINELKAAGLVKVSRRGQGWPDEYSLPLFVEMIKEGAWK